MNRLSRVALAVSLTATAVLGVASAAQAAPQLLIREAHRGATATGDYVMLQMIADGQNTLAGNYISILQADGQAAAQYPLPNVANGQSQRTVLIANTPASTPGADFYNAGVALQTDGGVCLDTHGGYDGVGGFDCVAWGNFVGNVHPLSSPALPTVLGGVGLAPGQTLLRTISRGCATALDAADDTNSSVADFALGAQIGRSNAELPSEKLCTTTPPATKKKCKKHKKKKSGAYSAKKKKCKKKKKH